MMNWLKALKNFNLFKKKKFELPKQPIHQEEQIAMDFPHQVAIQVLQQALTKSDNAVCSPVSIHVVLSMLAVGAENSTLEQLLIVLGHAGIDQVNAVSRKVAGMLKGSEEKGDLVISSLNALWLDQRFSLKAMFQEDLRDVHKAEARIVDFGNEPNETVKEVNSWAEEATKGLIKGLITREQIKAETVLLLANALHFKAEWARPFDPDSTRDGDFTLLNGDKVRVPFMKKYDWNFYYGAFKECQVLKMPYKRVTFNTYFSMYIFLPNAKDGLPNLMKNIKLDKNMFNDQFKLQHVPVDTIAIPLFRFETHVSLKDYMEQLGLTLPFDKRCSDFSRIADSPDPIYVDNIIQKCLVETNTQGTEAAAVCYDMIRATCEPPVKEPKPNFVADHPFLFMIREDVSGAILFIGTMVNPK